MDILTNRYFTVALLIIIIVLLYLYGTKQTCGIETMDNIDFTALIDECREDAITQLHSLDHHTAQRSDKSSDKSKKSKQATWKSHLPKAHSKKSNKKVRQETLPEIWKPYLSVARSKKSNKKVRQETRPEIWKPYLCDSSSSSSESSSD